MHSCCEDDSSSSNLVSSLRSYGLKVRTKYQGSSQLQSSESSKKLTSDQENAKEHSFADKTSTVNVSLNEDPQQNNSSDLSNLIPAAQNDSPLSYWKEEIAYTSQFILPCILTKCQQAIKRNSTAILDLHLTEEEYAKLKELLSKEAYLAELHKYRVRETTSCVTCGTRELKAHRQYLSTLCRFLRKYILSGASVLKDSSDNKAPNIFLQSNISRTVKTYSKTPKVITPNRVISNYVVTQSVDEHRVQ